MSTEREKLICFALLRQMQTPCPILRGAYQRLAEAASGAGSADVAAVVLGWVESELRSLRAQGGEGRGQEDQLMQAALALATVLRQ